MNAEDRPAASIGFSIKDRWLILGLISLALLPRLIGLQAFVTVAESAWMQHVVAFWEALLVHDWGSTLVTSDPGVGVAWVGGLGPAIYALFQPGLSLAEILAAIPPGRVVLFFLATMRLPLILLIGAGIGLIYRLLRPGLGRWPALLAAVLLAFEPTWVAYSRLLRPEALTAIFLLAALVALLRAARERGNSLIGAGILSGLAWSNSWTATLLIPFAAVLFVMLAHSAGNTTLRRRLGRMLEPFLFWLILAVLTWIVVWPAAWIEPGRLPGFVIQAAQLGFASPTVRQFPLDGGFFHYPTLVVFYTTPVAVIGLILWLIYRRRLAAEARYLTQGLLWFALIFLLLQTFFARKDAGAILPVFGAATIVAAVGWSTWASQLDGLGRRLVINGALFGQLLCVLPFVPYYLTYLNPLVGGPWLAPRLIEIGQGEGLDQVGAWLNGQPDAVGAVVGSDVGVALEPYFAGLVSGVTAPDLAYGVLYRSAVQRELPSPTILRYYQQVMEPAYIVRLGGVEYAAIYAGPAVQLPLQLPLGMITSILPRPLAFRPSAASAQRGGSVTVDVVWLTDPTMAGAESVLSLREPIDLGAFQAAVADLDPATIHEEDPSTLPPLTTTIFTEADAPLLRLAEGLTVSRHTLLIPPDLSPGLYSLVVDGRPLGHIQVIE